MRIRGSYILSFLVGAAVVIIPACSNSSLSSKGIASAVRSASAGSSASSPNATPSFTAENEIWQKMVNEATHDDQGNPLQIQPGCEPTHLLPKGPIIGTAILVHGYSACPQQFMEIGDLLADAGYQVYLPLSPGHGRVLIDGQEDLRGMPGRYDTDRYQEFTAEINELAAASPGLRMISGLSGGAAIALNAVETALAPYDRALIIAPWLHVNEDFFEGVLMNVERALPLGFGQVIKWGPSCLAERAHGRVGYCQTSLSNMAGGESFGQDVLGILKPTTTPIQLVGVENDPAVDVPTIVDAIGRLELPKSHVCFMPNGLPHSFFSRFDNIDDNPTWIPEFERDFVNYAVTGKFFPSAGSSIVEGFNQCPVKSAGSPENTPQSKTDK